MSSSIFPSVATNAKTLSKYRIVKILFSMTWKTYFHPKHQCYRSQKHKFDFHIFSEAAIVIGWHMYYYNRLVLLTYEIMILTCSPKMFSTNFIDMYEAKFWIFCQIWRLIFKDDIRSFLPPDSCYIAIVIISGIAPIFYCLKASQPPLHDYVTYEWLYETHGLEIVFALHLCLK